MRETILVQKKKGYIDFKFCETISAGAGLILAAETERCRILRFRNNRPTLTGNYPKNPIIHQFLGELGFFKILDIGYKPLSFDSDEKSSTQFITMRTARRDQGQELNYVTEVFGTGSVQLDNEAKVSLYEGLLEAMNNVTAHAYPIKHQEAYNWTLPYQWWAAGYWDRERREIAVLIYDMGVGIPATLKQDGYFADIQQRLGLGNSDQDKIKLAMEIGKSRLQSSHRGHGMATLRHAINLVSDGSLLILSGMGRYYVSNKSEKTMALPSDINGTFIEWRIRDENMITWKFNDG
ncbi:MAG: hypothetical protein OXC68_00545 [Aestuariivita sp.]|nr:hypothetical protein [Aestuariivita sp.]